LTASHSASFFPETPFDDIVISQISALIAVLKQSLP